MNANPEPPTRTVTGLDGYPMIGNIPKMVADPLQFLLDTAREHGRIGYLDLGPRSYYLVTDPDYVKYIVQDNYRNYIRGDSIATAKLLLGESLAMIDGDIWLSRRRLMQPAFHQRRLGAMTGTITDIVDELLARWQLKAQAGESVDMADEMMKLTLTIIVKVMFSTDISDQIDDLQEAFNEAQSFIYQRERQIIKWPLNWPVGDNRRFRDAVKLLDGTIYPLIRQRRQAGSPQQDLLAMLMAAQDEETGQGLSDDELRNEVLTVFFAGHETTATLLTWALYTLSQEPAMDDQLRAEVAAVLAGRPPAYDDVKALAFMGRFIDETLRLYPPAWIFVRETVADDQIGGYPIPAGTMIMLSPYVTQRDPAFWPDPERFDPERFQPDQVTERPRFAYYPFGGGPHLCIGQPLALMEAKLILAMICQRFRFALVPGHPIAFKPEVTLRPRFGLPMHLSPIDSA